MDLTVGKKVANRDPKPMGRPTLYTPELGAHICLLIENGATSRQIDEMPDLPSWPTINRWLSDRDDFHKLYARAREVSAGVFEAQILDEAAGADKETAQVARVRIDAWKWIMSKRAPKRYGDRIINEVVGKDGGAIQTETTTKVDMSKLSPEQREQLRDLMLTAMVKP